MEESFGEVIRGARERMGFKGRELVRYMENHPWTGGAISSGYLSSLERGKVDAAKVSIDLLWSLGVALEIDPLYLFVLSRPHISRKFLKAEDRRKLFHVED